MKRKRHTPEEIIKKRRAAEEALAGGKTVEDACRIISVSMATYQRWKSQYSGVKKDALKISGQQSPSRIFASNLAAMASMQRDSRWSDWQPGGF